MKKEELTSVEQRILKGLNARAALIIQVEETLREVKLPMDKSVLHSMTDEEIVGVLELLENMKENRKGLNTETKDQDSI